MVKLYKELAAEWYQLLTPLEDYEEEAEDYHKIFEENLKPETVLELGSGSGHNAFCSKKMVSVNTLRYFRKHAGLE